MSVVKLKPKQLLWPNERNLKLNGIVELSSFYFAKRFGGGIFSWKSNSAKRIRHQKHWRLTMKLFSLLEIANPLHMLLFRRVHWQRSLIMKELGNFIKSEIETHFSRLIRDFVLKNLRTVYFMKTLLVRWFVFFL